MITERINQKADTPGICRYLYKLVNYINRETDAIAAQIKEIKQTIEQSAREITTQKLTAQEVEAANGVFKGRLEAANIGAYADMARTTVSAAGGAWVDAGEITVEAGVYIAQCQARFASVAGGRRGVRIYNPSADEEACKQFVHAPATGAINLNCCGVTEAQGQTVYKVQVYHTAESNVSTDVTMRLTKIR